MKHHLEYDEYSVYVAGIPAIARITHYYKGFPGTGMSGEPESYQSMSPPEPEEINYVLCDRRGKRAEWLDKVADDKDCWDSITEDVIKAFHERKLAEL